MHSRFLTINSSQIGIIVRGFSFLWEKRPFNTSRLGKTLPVKLALGNHFDFGSSCGSSVPARRLPGGVRCAPARVQPRRQGQRAGARGEGSPDLPGAAPASPLRAPASVPLASLHNPNLPSPLPELFISLGVLQAAFNVKLAFASR